MSVLTKTEINAVLDEHIGAMDEDKILPDFKFSIFSWAWLDKWTQSSYEAWEKSGRTESFQITHMQTASLQKWCHPFLKAMALSISKCCVTQLSDHSTTADIVFFENKYSTGFHMMYQRLVTQSLSNFYNYCLMLRIVFDLVLQLADSLLLQSRYFPKIATKFV